MDQVIELCDLDHRNTVMHLRAYSAPNRKRSASEHIEDGKAVIEDGKAVIFLRVHRTLDSPAEETKFPSTILTFLSPPAAEKMVSFVLTHVPEITDRETLEFWRRWLLEFFANAAEDAAISGSCVLQLIVEICLRFEKDT